LTKSWLY